jgi:hypothetical protein
MMVPKWAQGVIDDYELTEPHLFLDTIGQMSERFDTLGRMSEDSHHEQEDGAGTKIRNAGKTYSITDQARNPHYDSIIGY